LVDQISTMKLGKKWNESTPHTRLRAGLTAGGSSMSMGRSHGPNSPLRSTRSIGFTMLMSFGGDMPPHDDTIPCGPSSWYERPSKPTFWSLRDSSATACRACSTGAW